MNKPGDLILPHGGLRKLRSLAVALAVYDGTVIYCNRFVDRRSRTHDQMLQAARSGVQNIAEGALASATSKKTEPKLTSVARAFRGVDPRSRGAAESKGSGNLGEGEPAGVGDEGAAGGEAAREGGGEEAREEPLQAALHAPETIPTSPTAPSSNEKF